MNRRHPHASRAPGSVSRARRRRRLRAGQARNPEPFLTAASKLGVAPADCLVFEDAEAGIASARPAACSGSGSPWSAGCHERPDGADVRGDPARVHVPGQVRRRRGASEAALRNNVSPLPVVSTRYVGLKKRGPRCTPWTRLDETFIYALRVLRRDRSYSLAVVLTLGVCMGANTAVFTVVRSVLLRPLPYADASRLVSSFDGFPGAGVDRAGTSVPNYADRRAMTDVFSSVALYQFAGYRMGEGARAEGVVAINVTPSFFDVLGTTTARGRLFTEAEGIPGKAKVVLVSHAFASAQPGGVDSIVGRQLRLNEVVYDVVGVLPPKFFFLNPEVRVFSTAGVRPQGLRGRAAPQPEPRDAGKTGTRWVTLKRAQAQIDAQNARVIEQAGVLKEALIRAGYTTKLQALTDDVVRNVQVGPADALGWSRVPGAHRRRQYRQPGDRPEQRADERAGDAKRHRRWQLSHR